MLPYSDLLGIKHQSINQSINAWQNLVGMKIKLCGKIIVMWIFDSLFSGPSCSWSYGSWIYNYLCNQCLSPLKLWVQIALMARCARYNM